MDRYMIGDEFATETKNLTGSSYPATSVRPGFVSLGEANFGRVLGLGVWKDTELHAVFADGTWRKWTGSAWSSPLVSGLNASAEWSFCNFKGNLGEFNLIGSNGIDPVKRYDGSSVQNLSGAEPGLNYIDEHDNRLYAVKDGNQVWFCELSVATNWRQINLNDSDPGAITKEINTGKKIVGLKAGTGHVTVFFPTACHELYGTSASDFRFMEVASDIGAINNKSAVMCDGYLYFVGESAYKYSGGTRPSREFSKRVQWHFDNMNPAAKEKVCCGTDGKRVYFALPVGSAAEPNTVLEYSPESDTWYTWNDLSPQFFARMGSDWYMAFSSGKIGRMGGTTDNGANISWRMVSKPFGSPSMSQIIEWLTAWIAVYLPQGSNINVLLSREASGENWILVKTLTSSSVLNQSLYIPTTIVANTTFIRIKLEGSGPMTLHEFSREQVISPLI
ncbi:hypothetical protein [Paenibacillus chitinolyticus]|uniref:hypothetical protein n=1 Tax=Paenibacillus chitinolyticus TaxID=79263 RepID=UPI003663AE9C